MSENKLIYIEPSSPLQVSDLLAEVDPTIKKLTIVIEKNKSSGWTLGPPLSAGNLSLSSVYEYPYFLEKLSLDKSNLTKLNYLDISSLGLKELPNLKFSKLSEARYKL